MHHLLKRLLDISLSSLLLLILSPLLLIISILIYWEDKHSPFYIAPRVGKKNKPFYMIKFRTMYPEADKTKVDSTASDDPRITPIGKILRRYKIDEIPQLWNVLKGEMSLVGPRPNVKRETDLYTQEEKRLLDVAPGITDLSSIIFSDESEILKGKEDANIAYNQLIRPWKSRLGLLYVEKQNLLLDLALLFITLVSLFSRSTALKQINYLLIRLGADPELIRVSQRKETLKPTPPPGSTTIVTSRQPT